MHNYFLLLLLCATSAVNAQKVNSKKPTSLPEVAPINYTIPLTPEKWEFQSGKAEFVTQNGLPAMKLNDGKGLVFIKDMNFKNGTIEYDVLLEPNLNLGNTPSIYFHGGEGNNAEIFYLRGRSNNPNANDAVQYAPFIKGVNMWDMYPEYQAPALFKAGENTRIKLVISGKQMRVYINDLAKPVLQIPQLDGVWSEGKIALDGAGTITNLIVKPDVVDDLPALAAPDLTDHDANYIRKWMLSKPMDFPNGSEVYAGNLPKADVFTDKIEAERRGLVNLTRIYGPNTQRRLVWLKVKIKSEEQRKNEIQLGFSDEVWVVLNNQMLYVDKNLYLQNMRKTPDGRISIQNATIPINFKKGDNELMIGVANDFYGWGIIARLENMEGIELK